MNAENNDLKTVKAPAKRPVRMAEFLYGPMDSEERSEPGYFVMTYNFHPIATTSPQSHGIRELKSPLSDY
jgi:hypothetical protein